jgi:L-2-hydroxyglutarate oxidase LhgO
MSQPDIECAVVGAGVIGLATAAALARGGREVLLLEAEPRAGEGVSSRNSGVIHAGLYYPTGSLKARLCVRGLQLMYDYCERRGVPHRRLGKLVVATREEERPALEALYARGLQNGVRLHWRERGAAQALEPALACVAAIDSPDSGVVDAAELVMALSGELQQAGGTLLCHQRVERVERSDGLFRLHTDSGDTLLCRQLVNAAGLGATALAAAIEGLPAEQVPRLYFGAGHYYTPRRKVPFTRLIYPLPQPGGLGVHLGFDLAGRARFGPDLRYRDTPDYAFDDSERQVFADAIRQWWPPLADDELQPDFVGLRPKLVGPGQHNPDFVIQDEAVHGLPGLVNLFGIESPGLTASLAIGEHVAGLLQR